MKRSEMVTKVADMLERHHDRYGNLHDFESVASSLIELVEEAGMLPPDVDGCDCIRGDGCRLCNPPSYYTWEPEDD